MSRIRLRLVAQALLPAESRLVSTLVLILTTTLTATDLPTAAETQDFPTIQTLLNQGVDVNQQQPDGMTALHWATHNDDLETAKLLIAAGANVSAENRYGVTPLSLACTNGNAAMIELLLESGADPNTTLRGGETALMTAARTGNAGAISVLTRNGANVNATETRTGQTALMWAAADGHVDAVNTLLKAGADLDATLDSGFNSLFFAVREGRTAVVKALLAAGADVNQALQPRKVPRKGARFGVTPLVLAVENGHFELAVELLEAGADPNSNLSGPTALHTIVWVRKPARGDGGDPAPQGSGNMTSIEFVKALIAHGADPNARLPRHIGGLTRMDLHGATPFFMASMTADIELMQTLLDLGADPHIPNAVNSTPLMAAAGLGTLSPGEDAGTPEEVLEAVKLNLSLGADINAIDNDGETAMHGAAYKHVPDVIGFLATQGADIRIWNQKNKHGWTPLTIAEGHRFGNFKPSPPTVAAFHKVMRAAGVTPPAPITGAVGKQIYK